jgi:small-conductance mechanosensitive channel
MRNAGSTFLNRGLGALNVRVRDDKEQSTAWCSKASVMLVLGCLISLPSVISIEAYFQLLSEETFFKEDKVDRAAGLSRLAGIPLTCAAVNYLITHVRRTTFWWAREAPPSYCCCCDPLARWPMLLATLALVRSAVLRLITDSVSAPLAFYIEVSMALILLSLYFALLDLIDGLLRGMVEEQELINTTKPVSKMQGLVSSITRSGRPDRDLVYCFAQSNTVPAEVLSYVWWFYYIVGKMLGVFITVSIFMGVQSSIISHMVIGGIAFSFVTASGFMFELGPNTLSLFRLSLNKPFYVGDLVTLNTNGAMDAPASSVMGFVENITMMYVVIRNFEMKQTWIPHNAFSKMIIQNWTRRPSKTVLLNIAISARCLVKNVEQLVAFGKRWIQASSEIQQTNYQKCHITKMANGYNVEIIFFPAIGVSHRGIRQKFLVAFMAAAERMKVPFVPLQLSMNFCDGHAGVTPNDETSPAGPDAMHEDLMPRPDDRLPKGVGMGFRAFPKTETPTMQSAQSVSEFRRGQISPYCYESGFMLPPAATSAL